MELWPSKIQTFVSYSMFIPQQAVSFGVVCEQKTR